MVEFDAALAAGLVAGALPSAPLIVNFITERRAHAVTRQQHAQEVERRTYAEAQSKAQGVTIQMTGSQHESDQAIIKSLREDNQQLQGEKAKAAAQAATSAALNVQRSQDQARIAELEAKSTQREAANEQLHRELQSEVAKKVCVHRYHGEIEIEGWRKRQKQISLFAVLHGKDVVAVEGDIAYLEHFRIPKEVKALIVTFLCAIGLLPPGGGFFPGA